MKYPLFKRRLMEFVMANYYARNTDVWVLGSREQYQAFRGLLLSGKGPERIVADVRGGMDLLVLPPAADAVRDFFVLHERLVYQSSRFNMELIIGGTKRGLGAVAAYFDSALRNLAPDADAHLHLDNDKLLIHPAVYLNIQAPIEDLEARLEELAPPSENDLLPDREILDPKLWPYEVLTYNDLHGRLPLRK